MKNKYEKILNIIVLVGIGMTLILLLALPFILSRFMKVSSTVLVMTVGIYICAIPYVLALCNLKKLCSHITSEDPYSRSIPRIISNIGYYSFSEIVLFNLMNIVFCFCYNIYFYGITILSCILISFLSFAIGIFAFVSSKLFERTIEIKEENDNTI